MQKLQNDPIQFLFPLEKSADIELKHRSQILARNGCNFKMRLKPATLLKVTLL